MGLIIVALSSRVSRSFERVSDLHIVAALIDSMIVGLLFFQGFSSSELLFCHVACGAAELLILIDGILLGSYFRWNKKKVSLGPSQDPIIDSKETPSTVSKQKGEPCFSGINPQIIERSQQTDPPSGKTVNCQKETLSTQVKKEEALLQPSSVPVSENTLPISSQSELPPTSAETPFQFQIQTPTGRIYILDFDARSLEEILEEIWLENGGRNNCRFIVRGQELSIDSAQRGREWVKQQRIGKESVLHLVLNDSRRRVKAPSSQKKGKEGTQGCFFIKDLSGATKTFYVYKDKPVVLEDVRRKTSKKFTKLPIGLTQGRLVSPKLQDSALLAQDAGEVLKLVQGDCCLHWVGFSITEQEAELLVEDLLMYSYPGLKRLATAADTLTMAYTLMWSQCERIFTDKQCHIGKELEEQVRILEELLEKHSNLNPLVAEQEEQHEPNANQSCLKRYLGSWLKVGQAARDLWRISPAYRYESEAFSLEGELSKYPPPYKASEDESFITIACEKGTFAIPKACLIQESSYFAALFSNRYGEKDADTLEFEEEISSHLLTYLAEGGSEEVLETLSLEELFGCLKSAEAFCFSKASLLCLIHIARRMGDLASPEYERLKSHFMLTPFLTQLATLYESSRSD